MKTGDMVNFKEMAEMLKNPEPLVPELSITYSDGLLKHPLVTMPINPMHGAIANMALIQKKEMLKEAEAKRDWGTVIMLHERHARLLAFHERMHLLPPAKYWELLGDIWIGAEFPSEDLAVWLELFKADCPDRASLMSVEEISALSHMPDHVTIYRGYSGTDASLHGMSWTLSRKTAGWFAERFRPEKPVVGEGRCCKEDILAYFTGRGEQEIVIDPRAIRNIREIKP